jgi:uncharacterized membrane protein YkvA (DUF1232 family)
MMRLLRLWRIGGKDLRLLWFALRQPDRPVWLLPLAMLLGVYALEPLNFLVPLLGIVDDFVVLPLVLHFLLKLLPSDIHRGFAQRATRIAFR